jgi:hypothetical protein
VTTISSHTPEAAPGLQTAAHVTDKRGYGQRWGFSVRMIDNLLAQGLPHCKVGERRVRILVPEADAWMRERYGTQRRKVTSKKEVRSAP